MQARQLNLTSLVLLIALTTTLLLTDQLVQCQLLQAQSPLGRLVQSITSPLVLSATSYDGADSDDSPHPASFNGPLSDSPLAGLSQAPSSLYNNMPSPASTTDTAAPASPLPSQHFQRYEQQQHQQSKPHQLDQQHYQHYQPSRAKAQQHQQQLFHQQHALQQAPSQERGVPQHYYASGNSNHGPTMLDGAHDGHQSHDDEDAGAPSSPARKQQSAAQEYQMGAYLGPTIDDKEIQGAFNSNNDDKDDDEGSSAGFNMGNGGDGSQRAANSYGSPQADHYGGGGGSGNGAESSYGQPDGESNPWLGMPSYGSGEQAASVARGNNGYGAPRDSASFDDDSSADEDDDSMVGRGAAKPDASRFRTSASRGMKQAASQYHQRQNRPRGGGNQQQMLAAANGYAPYGYANGPAGGGPIDLSSLMAGGPGAYEVYNGDGSYPGQGYYQQQGNGGGRGRHNQAASSMMNNNGPGPYGYNNAQQQQQQQRGNDNDDQDDADDD